MKKQRLNLYSFLSTSWLLIISFQVLRIEYNFIYLPILILFLIYNSFIIVKIGKIFLPFDFLTLNIWIFFVLTIYIFGMTFFYGDLNEFLKAFPRAIIMPLSLIFFYNFLELNKFEKILKIYLFICFIGSLSLGYQIFIEPLDFIVKGGGLREGMPRYATTLGSLTVYGGVVGILLILSSLLKLHWITKILYIVSFTLGGFFCVSKSGIMNLFIFSFFYIFLIKIKHKYIQLILILILCYILFYNIDEIQNYVNASYNSLALNDQKPTGLENQFIFRFFGFQSLEQHSFWENILGFGLIGGQGAFGLPYSISGTTHNQFFDAIQIGGFLLFFNILSIFICLICDLFNKMKKDDDHLSTIFFYCNIIAIINMFFFNGFMYQPITSFVIWLSIAYLIKKKENEKNI